MTSATFRFLVVSLVLLLSAAVARANGNGSSGAAPAPAGVPDSETVVGDLAGSIDGIAAALAPDKLNAAAAQTAVDKLNIARGDAAADPRQVLSLAHDAKKELLKLDAALSEARDKMEGAVDDALNAYNRIDKLAAADAAARDRVVVGRLESFDSTLDSLARRIRAEQNPGQRAALRQRFTNTLQLRWKAHSRFQASARNTPVVGIDKETRERLTSGLLGAQSRLSERQLEVQALTDDVANIERVYEASANVGAVARAVENLNRAGGGSEIALQPSAAAGAEKSLRGALGDLQKATAQADTNAGSDAEAAVPAPSDADVEREIAKRLGQSAEQSPKANPATGPSPAGSASAR